MHSIIAIDGFTASGKSFLAARIVSELAAEGRASVVLSTDDFIKYRRNDRTASPEQYRNHRDWYDLDRLAAIVGMLRAVAPVDMTLHQLYNHATGERDGVRSLKVSERATVIVEGMYALAARIPYSYRIILVAPHPALQDRSVLRDTSMRSVALPVAVERYWTNNGAGYQRTLSAALSDADLVADTGELSAPEIVLCSSLGIQRPHSLVAPRYMPHVSAR
jgi:uridine kinase